MFVALKLWLQVLPALWCAGQTSLQPEWCKCGLRPTPECPSLPPPWWCLTPTQTDAVSVSPRWNTPWKKMQLAVGLFCFSIECFCLLWGRTFLHMNLDLIEDLNTRSLRMEANGVTPIPPPTRTDTSKSTHSWWPSPNGPSKYSYRLNLKNSYWRGENCSDMKINKEWPAFG